MKISPVAAILGALVALGQAHAADGPTAEQQAAARAASTQLRGVP